MTKVKALDIALDAISQVKAATKFDLEKEELSKAWNILQRILQNEILIEAEN